MAIRKVAFIGLGVMGYPMAGHLSKAGFAVNVYNRTSSKAQQWSEEYQDKAFDTPRQAVEDCDAVFVCVGNDQDVLQVCEGEDGVLAGLKPGAILVDHTTASAELAQRLAGSCQEQNNGFIDAPVSGGQAGAENGVLTIMCGGDAEVFAQVKPVMDAYARFSQLMGPVGDGQKAKMANQICIAGVVQGLSEALNFASRAGLDTEKLVETISKGAAGSWQMENRSATMVKGEFDFGFAVDWMRKDLAIAFNEAAKHNAELPMTTMVDGFYEQVQKLGGSRWDTSSLIALLQNKGK
ncbi:NAD(P)-dependent oxidoreductase [Thalassotalea mangrovi]|uniref:NAD(P)-dependent oxidoreductase n=1 Tax=Thalassotalea mangrovi TaxID=2572245 RepID=A0A4U1B4Q7_9GAMM|nr:NAD(P)-dependent oxidoreductase [Thalassotalea mangrovi]TKB44771.1 NAD(P)-dependent oxidoreductase [Thalassotalea mangrovi]